MSSHDHPLVSGTDAAGNKQKAQKEEQEGMHNASAARSANERHERRLAANRRSARKSRYRTKVLVDELQESVKEMTTRNAALRQENEEIRKELAKYAHRPGLAGVDEVDAGISRSNCATGHGAVNHHGKLAAMVAPSISTLQCEHLGGQPHTNPVNHHEASMVAPSVSALQCEHLGGQPHSNPHIMFGGIAQSHSPTIPQAFPPPQANSHMVGGMVQQSRAPGDASSTVPVPQASPVPEPTSHISASAPLDHKLNSARSFSGRD